MASNDGFECDTAAMRVLFGYDTFYEILHYLPRAQWFPLRSTNKLLQQYVSSICKTSTVLRICDLRGACMNFSAERVLLCAHIITRSLMTNINTVDFRDAEKDGTQPQQLGMRARRGIHSLRDIGRNGSVFCSPIVGPLLSCLAHNIGQRITSLCLAGLTLRTEALEALEHGLPSLETLDVTGVTATGVVDPDSYIGTPADPHRGQLAAIFGWTRRAGQAGRQGNVPASSAFSGVREPGLSPSQEQLVYMQNAPAWAACRGGRLRHLFFTGTNLARRWKLEWFASTTPGLGLVSFETRFLEPDMLLSLAASSGYGTPPSQGLSLGGTAYVSSLRSLTIVGTRVCELRINSPALEAVLQRLETLALIDCDLQPRPHLLQPPCDVLASILAVSPRLHRLRLEDIPSPELRDGFWSELVHSIRGKKELLLSREAGKRSARQAKADKIAAIDAQAAAAYLASFADEESAVDAALSLQEGAPDRAGRMLLGPPPLQELHISPANAMQLPAVRALCTLFGASLRVFSIGGTLPRLNDACLSHVASTCSQLEELHAPFCTDVTDTGILNLAHGSRGPRLRRINLSRCNLHRASTLATLVERCRSLQWLAIRGCHAAVMDRHSPQGYASSAAPPLYSAQDSLLPGDHAYVSTTRALWDPVRVEAGPGGLALALGAIRGSGQQADGHCLGTAWPHSTWQDIDSGMHEHRQGAFESADASTRHSVATGADVLDLLRARGVQVVYDPSLRVPDPATRTDGGTHSDPSLPASSTTFPCPNVADASTWRDASLGSVPRCTATCATQADLTDHMENVCPFGMVPCLTAGCSVRMPRYELSRHLSDACTAYMVQCMLCPASVLRYQLERHLRAHADTEKEEDARIHCACVSYGCGWSVPSASRAVSSPNSTSLASYPTSADSHHHHHHHHHGDHSDHEATACAGMAAAARHWHRHKPGKHTGTSVAQGTLSAYKCISCAADLPAGVSPPRYAQLCTQGGSPLGLSMPCGQKPVDGIAPALLCYVTGLLRCRMPHIEDCDACPPPVLLAAGSVHVGPLEVPVLQAQLRSLLSALNPALEAGLAAATADDAAAIALSRAQSPVCA